MQRICKDSHARKNYTIDWSTEIGEDLIVASTWTPVAGITVDATSFTDTTTTVWVEGGTPGAELAVVNHIQTAGGLEEDETIYFLINEE